MNEPKVYMPGASMKRVEFPGGGAKLAVGLNVEKVVAFLNEHRNERGYVNIDIVRRKEPDQYGNTHYAVLNAWKPKQQAAPGGEATPRQAVENPDDLPF